MERSRQYNMNISRASRARIKQDDPNLSMRSGTYHLYKSISESEGQNAVYIPANTGPPTHENAPATSPRGNSKPNAMTEKVQRNRSLSPRVLARTQVLYDPMPSFSKSPVSPNGVTVVTQVSNDITPQKTAEKRNGYIRRARSKSPKNVSVRHSPEQIPKSLQIFEQGESIKSRETKAKSFVLHNGTPGNHIYSRPLSPQYRVVSGVKPNTNHYQNKGKRSRMPTDRARRSAPVSRTMSLNIGAKTSKSYISIGPSKPAEKLDYSVNSKRPPTKYLDTSLTSSKSKFDDSVVTQSSINDTWTANSFLNTSVATENSFHSNMYEVYLEKCQKKNVLFEDPNFSATDESIYSTTMPIIGPIKWLRPKEITANPTFLENGRMKFNIIQGKLGTSWLVGAFSCLMQTPNLIKQCVPGNQGFGEGYVGIFHFRFWRYGQWEDVIVDDRLPTVNGELICLHCQNSSDFWVALFEKAFAKRYGCYENILGGCLGWSLEDIVGGITQTHNLCEAQITLQKALSSCMSRTSLLGASISTDTTGGQRTQLLNGLISGHVYSITGYAELPVPGGATVLLRLRNCWGKVKWNGAWSEGSDNWNALTEEDKSKIRKIKMADGEFWISYKDFMSLFTLLEICYLTPESWKREPKLQSRQPWTSSQGFRQWRRGYNSGGGPNSPLVSYNCQFYLELSKPSGIVVSLLQQHRSVSAVPCACLVYNTHSEIKGRLGYSDFNQTSFMASSVFHDGRENTTFFQLDAGFYIILPVTQNESTEGKFLFRILTEGGSKIRELDEQDKVIPISPSRLQDGASLHGLRRKFLYAINQDEELDSQGLQHILDHKHSEVYKLWCCQSDIEAFQFKPMKLSLGTCKSAIAIVDQEMKGKLNFEEFNNLLSLLMYWQEIFHKMSRGSVSMETYSLRTALRMTGFVVSNRTLEALIIRYANKETMELESFVHALVKLSVAHQRHNLNKQENEKERTLFLQELLRAAIYS